MSREWIEQIIALNDDEFEKAMKEIEDEEVRRILRKWHIRYGVAIENLKVKA